MFSVTITFPPSSDRPVSEWALTEIVDDVVEANILLTSLMGDEWLNVSITNIGPPPPDNSLPDEATEALDALRAKLLGGGT